MHDGRRQGVAFQGRLLIKCSAWCFDLLALYDCNTAALPLTARKRALDQLLKKARHPMLRYSDSFDDALKLLRQASVMGLEGIVSKRIDQPYVGGNNRGWVKVKTHDWREANKDSGELFSARG
jgi:bifunctional non-homologous end joining protein LigD